MQTLGPIGRLNVSMFHALPVRAQYCMGVHAKDLAVNSNACACTRISRADRYYYYYTHARSQAVVSRSHTLSGLQYKTYLFLKDLGEGLGGVF